MELKYYELAKKVDNKNISMKYINTNDNIADMLTKHLTVTNFKRLTKI